MNSYKVVRAGRQSVAVVPACAAFLVGVLSLPAFGEASVGLVGGITRESSSGKPAGEAQVTAHNLDKGTDQVTVTDADGMFAFTNLEPGPYEVAATKNGFQKSLAHVEVAARRTAQVELSLQVAADLRRATEKSESAPLTERERQLLER